MHIHNSRSTRTVLSVTSEIDWRVHYSSGQTGTAVTELVLCRTNVPTSTTGIPCEITCFLL